MSQEQIITSLARRRFFTEDEKRAFLAAAFVPGGNVRQYARENDIAASALYRWRKALGTPLAQANKSASQEVDLPAFVRVIPSLPAPGRTEQAKNDAIELSIGGNRVTIPSSMPPALAAAVVAALVKS